MAFYITLSFCLEHYWKAKAARRPQLMAARAYEIMPPAKQLFTSANWPPNPVPDTDVNPRPRWGHDPG